MPSRAALITGANRGIGEEIARQLAAAGITVVIGSRDLSAGQVAARALGPNAQAEQLDVSDPDSVAACERRLADAGVEVDILVNKAGLYTTTPLLAIEERARAEALQVNFIGAWRVRTGHARSQMGSGRKRLNWLCALRRASAASRRGRASASEGLVECTHAEDRRRGRRCRQGQLDVAGLGGDPNGRQRRPALADTAVWLATLHDNGPTDGFYYDRQRIPR